MNFSLLKREFVEVWSASWRAVIVPMILLVTVLSVTNGLLGFLALLIGPPMALWAFAQAHQKGYEAAHAAEGVKLPMAQWWWQVGVGGMIWGALFVVGAVFFALPGLLVMSLLMPYVYFMMVEGLGPVKALEANLRLVSKHPVEAIVMWMAIFALQIVMVLFSQFVGGVVAIGAAFLGSELVLFAVVVAIFIVHLAVAVFGMSLQVAGAITIYRVVTGKVAGISSSGVVQEQGAVSAVPVPATAAPPGEW
ncbi:hypothetical protein FRC98_17905 [Lujinxingia vulgaris]|uniref:Glycerophosphoryl diester phosphodiesterase membrane domain-containing protein n=1 Tax=Lujinxingia vulgaris TaxID=2600176 RepID=A0A5C6X8H4_9DELT|nr:hypothetical protein [Lujinxingia vulgaris]TXD34993.1 hypothetical protein FRC98_17905 [Lujinxingia vulgaris]